MKDKRDEAYGDRWQLPERGVIDTADGRGNQMEGSPVGENPG